MEHNISNFRYQIKKERLNLGLKANFISNEIYIEQSLYSKFENGVRNLDKEIVIEILNLLRFDILETKENVVKQAYDIFNNAITAYLKRQKNNFVLNYNELKKSYSNFFVYQSSTYVHGLILDMISMVFDDTFTFESQVNLKKIYNDIDLFDKNTSRIVVCILCDYFLMLGDFNLISDLIIRNYKKFGSTDILIYYKTLIWFQADRSVFEKKYSVAISKSVEKLLISRVVNLSFYNAIYNFLNNRNLKNLGYFSEFLDDVSVDFELMDTYMKFILFIKKNKINKKDFIYTMDHSVNFSEYEFKIGRKTIKFFSNNNELLTKHLELFYDMNIEYNFEFYINMLLKFKNFAKLELIDEYFKVLEHFELNGFYLNEKIKLKEGIEKYEL